MSLMQRRRATDEADGGGDAVDERTADEMLEDLMEDLQGSPSRPIAAVRSVRVVEGSAQAQPEGGTQEVVVAGAGGPQPGHNGGAQGVMEGLSPDQQAILRQAAEVLRTGVQLQWQAAPPAALGDAGIRRPEHLPGGHQHAERAGGTDPGQGQRGDQRAQGVGDGGLLGPLALPAGGLEPLVLRPEGLPPAPQGDPVVLGPGGHQGGAEQREGHPPDQVQRGGHQPGSGQLLRPLPEPHGVQAVVRTPEGVGGQRNPFWSDRAMASGDQPVVGGLHGAGSAQRALSSGRVKTVDGLTHKDLLDLEALRVQGFKEVEAQIQRELEKRKGENSGSGSFQSVLGEGGVGQGSKTPVDPALGQLVMPPGLSGSSVPAAATAPVVNVGENLNENLRNLELPKLSPDSTSVDFGDWLTIVGPLMADLSGTSSQWWALVLDAATKTYAAWVTSTPLQRLRLKVLSPVELAKWPRTEQRAVTMLLAAIPDQIRRELISSRKLQSTEILYTLLCRFQPGGVHEKTSLLKDLTENRLGANANIHELLQTLRVWRRNMGRSAELNVQLPDPLILVGVLGRWSDHLGRLGGPQTVYRMSSLRQDLQLDFIPTNDKVADFAEALQAEAEQLSLASASATSTTTTSLQDTKKKEQIKAAALRPEGSPTSSGDGKGKAKCRFWGSTAGCRRGESCTFEHSWDGLQRRGRCWNCSGEGHMKPDCPYLKSKDDGQREGSGSPTKISKVKDPKGGSPKNGRGKGGSKGGTMTSSPSAPFLSSSPGTTATSSSSHGASEEKSKVVIEEIQPTVPANLASDLSGLVKSLQGLKAVQLRYIESKTKDVPNGGDRKLALLDGGATHGLRRGLPHELEGAEVVTVELAHGSTTLFRKAGCSTLLAKEEVEPIVPVRQLIEAGYQLKWSSSEVAIWHPTKGSIKCWRRQGCPVLDRDDGLALLQMLEDDEAATRVGQDVKDWWKERYPQVPDAVIDFMKGQFTDWKKCPQGLPWNRRRRRQLETANAIVLHLFSGDKESSKKWLELQKLGYEVLTLDVASNSAENLHSPAIWSYLMMLARQGRLRILVGGPPCRTFSRLRHQAPGPRPVRGRAAARWSLPNLTPLEAERVNGDSALVLKMAALYEEMEENAPQPGINGFLLEHPEDPKEYLGEAESKELPSVWDWPELKAFAERFNLKMVSFDQGKCGHSRRKPTTLLTNLPGMDELQGLRCGKNVKGFEPLAEDLPQRLKQASSWSSWAWGLTQAIKESIKMMTTAGLKRLSLDEWRQHVRQNHAPYRRDCRLCECTRNGCWRATSTSRSSP